MRQYAGTWRPYVVLLVLLTLVTSGCGGGGGGGTSVAGGPVPCPPVPFVNSVTPTSGCPGDVITIEGVGFSPEIENNRVVFRDVTNEARVRGKILAVTNTGSDICGDIYSLEVLIPTNAPGGFIEIVSDRLLAGNLPFEMCPQIIGVAVGEDNDLVAIRQTPITMSWSPAQFVVYGYGFSTVFEAVMTDSSGLTETLSVNPGIPAGSAFTIPPGMEALTIETPQSLVPICLGGVALVDHFPLTLTADIGAQAFSSNEVMIPAVAEQLVEFPASFSGVVASSGVRAGQIRIEYSLVEQPSNDRWDVNPMYQDPVSGDFLPCTEVPNSNTGTATFSGALINPSTSERLLGPGNSNTFIWDTRADLPDFLGSVVVRLLPENPSPGIDLPCDPATWMTAPVVIDNNVTSGSFAEFFDDMLFADLANSNAAWAETPGVLEGRLLGSLQVGAGTVDLVLEAFESYVFATDIGEVFLNGMPLLGLDNPGAPFGEFHLRTLEIEPSAEVEIIGSNPLVIRCSGSGDPLAVAVNIASNLDLNGADGTSATATVPGVGGAGAPGGGDGGDGASIEVLELAALVVGATLAERGGNNGGHPGSALTYLRGAGVTQARAGTGGGGGHATPGQDGVMAIGSSFQAPTGRGGPARGSAAVTTLTGGSGGGGGGGVPYRPTTTGVTITARSGGGGGGGGGAIEIVCAGSIVIDGSISANGGEGGNGASPGGGAGGGGSGGTIALRATGGVSTAPNTLTALGGDGGGNGSNFIGGDGAEGRIRIEAFVNSIAAGAFEPDLDAVTLGQVNPLDGGSGADGSLLLEGMVSPVTLDTDNGEIRDGGGSLIATSALVEGAFQFTSLSIPQGAIVRGVGVNPLIIKCTGSVLVAGVLDVSGEAGGEFDPTASSEEVLGGAGGPGGGAGGSGGFLSTAGLVNGADGGFPVTLPTALIASPFGTPSSGPVPLPLAQAAAGGLSQTILCPVGSCDGGGGGGGGFGTPGANGVNSLVTPGAGSSGGGSDFGFEAFTDPFVFGALLPLGGGGGAGGGAGLDVAQNPLSGTGGGGGGGFLQLTSSSTIELASTGTILARGGDAFQGPGHNGGAGAGGGVLLQGASLRIAAGTVDVSGGAANLGSDPSLNLGAGGDGGRGRVRLEAGIALPPTVASLTDTPVESSPPASIGDFDTAQALRSVALSFAYSVTDVSGVFVAPLVIDSTVIDAIEPLGTSVIPLFEGACSFSGPFEAAVGDPSDLPDDADFVRMRWQLFSDLPTAAVPQVESFELFFGTP